MSTQRGTIKQLITKNGLLDNKECFSSGFLGNVTLNISRLPSYLGTQWGNDVTRNVVIKEVINSTQGAIVRAETWREFFNNVDTSQYSILFVNKEAGITLTPLSKNTAPMTAEEKVCREEHAQLAKLAKEKGHTTPLKMWEENHWKDDKGRWHKENNDSWDGETGIGEKLPEIYAEQMEKEVKYKADVWEEKQLANALNFEQMSVTKLLELEPDYPALHNDFKEYLHSQNNEWVEKIFWEEYDLVKAGGEAEF